MAFGWRSAGVTAIDVGAPSRVRRIDSDTGAPTLPRNDPTGPERAVVRRQDLVAEQEAGLMRRGALDHAGHEGPPLIVGLGEDPDAGIGHFAVRKDTLQPSMLEGRRRKCRRAGNRPDRRACNSACGRRRASPSIALTTAASSSARAAPPRPAGGSARASPASRARSDADRRSGRARAPTPGRKPSRSGFGRALAAQLKLRLGAGRPRPEGERGRNGENVPTRCFHGARCFRLLMTTRPR